jgi:hypothetical protein
MTSSHKDKLTMKRKRVTHHDGLWCSDAFVPVAIVTRIMVLSLLTEAVPQMTWQQQSISFFAGNKVTGRQQSMVPLEKRSDVCEGL